MLSNVRQLVVKAVIGLIFVLLIASFALWGIEDVFRGGGRTAPVISAGETEIDSREFSRDFQRQYQQYSQMFGGQLDIQTAQAVGIVDQIVNDAVTRALFAEQARRLGLRATDASIATAIRAEQSFAGANGQFDRLRFEQVLRSQNLSEAQFVAMVREDLDRAAIAEASVGAVRAPTALARQLQRYESEERIARYLVIDAGDMEVGEPTNEELRAYYEANEEEFRAPEYRSVSVVHLTPDDLIDEISVDEEELRAEYEARRDSLGTPELRSLRQLLVSDKEEAAAIEARLAEGDSLEEAAEAVLGEADLSELGENTRSDLPGALGELAFSLEEGEAGGPAETGLGWHFLVVDAVQEGDLPEFEEVREELRRELARDDAVNSLVNLANQLDDRLAGGASLEEAASGLDLRLVEIEAIDQQGLDLDGAEVPELPRDDNFVSLVFSTEIGQQSLLRETQDRGYYVLRVNDVIPSDIRPFEEVTEAVAEGWAAEQRREAAIEAAEALRARVSEEGVSFEEAAEAEGYELRLSEPVTRGAGQGLRQILASALFSLQQGEIEVIDLNDGAVVAELREIHQPEAASEAVERRRQQLEQTLRNELLQQYTNALRQEIPVQFNQSQLDQILERY